MPAAQTCRSHHFDRARICGPPKPPKFLLLVGWSKAIPSSSTRPHIAFSEISHHQVSVYWAALGSRHQIISHWIDLEYFRRVVIRLLLLITTWAVKLLTLVCAQKPQSWVSQETLVTSAPPPVPSVPTTVRRTHDNTFLIPKARIVPAVRRGSRLVKGLTCCGVPAEDIRSDLCQQGRSALSKLVASLPTPVLVPSAFTSSALAVATTSTGPYVLTRAISPGAPRAAPARPVSSVSSTIRRTTSWSAPTLSRSQPSSRLMPPPSDSGTRPTTANRSVAGASRSRLARTLQRRWSGASPSRRSRLHGTRLRARSNPLWRNSSKLVGCLLLLLADLANRDVVTVIFWRVTSSHSTNASCTSERFWGYGVTDMVGNGSKGLSLTSQYGDTW